MCACTDPSDIYPTFTLLYAQIQSTLGVCFQGAGKRMTVSQTYDCCLHRFMIASLIEMCTMICTPVRCSQLRRRLRMMTERMAVKMMQEPVSHHPPFSSLHQREALESCRTDHHAEHAGDIFCLPQTQYRVSLLVRMLGGLLKKGVT